MEILVSMSKIFILALTNTIAWQFVLCNVLVIRSGPRTFEKNIPQFNLFQVVCPVCASMPGGEPNFVTDDFAGHLTLEHRTGPRDLISFLISFSNYNLLFRMFTFMWLFDN